LAQLLHAMNRVEEAEPLARRALTIAESSYGSEHPSVAISLNNLAQILKKTNRMEEAKLLMRQSLVILIQTSSRTGYEHEHLNTVITNYMSLLQSVGWSDADIQAEIDCLFG